MSEINQTPTPSPDAAPPNQRLHALVFGDVQGVGFRAHTMRAALRLDLTGWVRNTWDGAVETMAEGAPGALNAFEHALRIGPTAAEVERVDATYEAATGEFSGFHIRY